jgi:hypothetical protein
MWNDSVLLHTRDALLDCDTTTAAIATMMFEANVDIIKSPSLTELLTTKSGEAAITKRFQLASLMKSFNRVLLLDGEAPGLNATGDSDIRNYYDMVSANNYTPELIDQVWGKRKLFGHPAGSRAV